ncbi:MAG: transcriptional regulator [Bacteroidetes bacterium]|jgi:DNA-binding CsgD family transcriptional regulator|nr:transcriptional regulator [Bacteroidota bacterium]
MLKDKNIAVITSHFLEGRGLLSLLVENFEGTGATLFASPSELSENESNSYDLFFVSTDLFILHYDYFLPRKNKAIVFGHTLSSDLQHASQPFLNTNASESDVTEQICSLLDASVHQENSDGLTARETEVLTLVAQGLLNKEIADQLGISLHTVISHRKNIASKLGIKTVSGFTMYAAMNGLISLS